MKIKLCAILMCLLIVFAGCENTSKDSAANVSGEDSSASTPNASIVAPSAEPETAPEESFIIPPYVEEGISAPEGMKPLKELPYDYTGQQAAEDGCFSPGFGGEELYDDFLSNAASGKSGMVRAAYCFGQKGGSKVYDITFDGEKFISQIYHRDKEKDLEYEQMWTVRVLTDDEIDSEGNLLDSLHNNYNNDVELAKEDGCVIIHTQAHRFSPEYFTAIEHGKEIWDEFYSRVKAGKPAKVRLATMTGAVADGVFELEAYDLEFDGRYFWFTDYVARPEGESVHHVERSYRYTYMLKDQTVTLGRKDLDVFVLTLSDQYTWSYMDRTADDAALASDFPFIVPNEVVYFELSE